jgi:hypothetical protein
MEKALPYRLVRDALGFYSQVPIVEVPDVVVIHERIVPVCEPAKPRKMGRPPKKARLNADFEVDLP